MSTRYEKFNELTFEAYVKSAIEKSVLKAQAKRARAYEREQPFSMLSDAVLYTLAAESTEIERSEMGCYVFDVRGIQIPVYGHDLGQALFRLMPRDREIVLLYFFFGLDDNGIAKVVSMSRSAVQRHRKSAINQLRNILEDAI